jgi:hypothetical protein
MLKNIITPLTPFFVGKCLSSQIHDWSGNGGGKVPNWYRTLKYKKFPKFQKNSEKFEKELLIRNK